MTLNGTAIRALRHGQRLSLRRLARLAQTSPSQLSRIERGRAGAGDDLTLRLAEALAVPVVDITRGEVVAMKERRPVDAAKDSRPHEGVREQRPASAATETGSRAVPYPGTPEGSFFHYTPEEAATFLPWSALQLKRKAYAREVPFNGGGARVTFTGRNICEISEMTAVRPLAETVQARSA
ncbi:helix-turn-helix domain-containing protein [Actinacidiphila acididurans]|uniref:Helix-turn-helix domain-containing protein n=1 Tax=Actinacidiphila acididurans TaxID=2784346 RepID=A0ABS2TTQ8_9ACTN|nr:helix-turn-helix transcriptional regulator [Actinacidiphila acididurans]MBM9506724.1 helix-turn-helix domain-containing protein [Actinacidiphila acididurans]